MRRILSPVLLATLASVLLCATAFAAAPPAKVTVEAEPAASGNSGGIAGGALDAAKKIADSLVLNDPAAIEAKLRSAAGKYNASQQVQPAIGSNGAGGSAPGTSGAPATPTAASAYTGPKKVIYGDIIIHK